MDKGRIKRKRLEAGLTQAVIADAVGISLRHYRSIEYHDVAPSVWTALQIAVELDTSVGYLWPLDRNAELQRKHDLPAIKVLKAAIKELKKGEVDE